MKKFIKVDGLQLINGGYLSDKDGSPVFNAEFVAAQKRAEYVCVFAKHAKNKDFKGKEADSLSELRKLVNAELAGKTPTYVAIPEKPVKKISNQLADEAMKFMDWEDNTTKIKKVNAFLQEFNVLAEFEAFGLFFEDDIVKLDKIYSMEDVTAAVEQTIELIG